MKKIIALVLVLTLAVSVFAGCVQPVPPTTTKPQGGETQPSDEAGLKEVTVSILGIDRSHDSKYTQGGEWVNLPAGAAWKKMLDDNKINLEFKWIMFDNNTYQNTVATRVGTGVDLADIIFVESYRDNVNTWGNYGFVQNLLPLIEKYDTDGSIKQFYYDHGAGLVWEQAMTENGELFFLPGISGLPGAVTSDGEEIPWAQTAGFLIRKDWLRNVGINEVKEVYTPDELIDLVKAMRDGDANKDGKNNEYIYSKVMNSDFSGISYAFHMSPYGIGYFGDTQGKTVFASNNFTSPYFADYVKWFQDALEAGVYNSDFLAGVFNRDLYSEGVMWENGGSGFIGYGYDAGTGYGVFPDKTRFELVPIKVDVNGSVTGSYQQVNNYLPSSYVSIAISSTCKDPEGAIRLLDLCCTEEYALLNCFGVEGKGFEYDDNGVPVSKFALDNPETWHLGECLWGCFPQHNIYLPYVTTDFPSTPENIELYWNPEFYQEATDRQVKYMKEDLDDVYTSVAIWPVHDQEQKDIIDTYEGQLRTAMSEYFLKFVFGELDVEKDMPAVLNELEEKYHMSEVIEANLKTLSKMYEVVERP